MTNKQKTNSCEPISASQISVAPGAIVMSV